MRNLILLNVLLLFSALSFAQTPPEFKEGQAVVIEGVEFLYTLGIEEVKTIDGVQYSFFNVEWFITNRGKFSKIWLLEKDKIVENPEYDMTKKAYLGKIFVMNGIQLQATKKFDVISAEPNMEIVTYSKRLVVGNRRNINEGFNLQSGQTVNSSLVVAVAKGQRPIITLQPFISSAY